MLPSYRRDPNGISLANIRFVIEVKYFDRAMGNTCVPVSALMRKRECTHSGHRSLYSLNYNDGKAF